MSFLRRLLTETATYWAPASTPYNSYGDQSFAAAVDLDPDTNTGVRWEDRTVLFIDPMTGDEAHSHAIIYGTTAFVVGGFLYLGTSASSTPESVTGADRIRRVDKVPDMRGDETLYKAIL